MPIKPFARKSLAITTLSFCLIACYSVIATPSLWSNAVDFDPKVESLRYSNTDSSGNTFQYVDTSLPSKNWVRKVDSSGNELWSMESPFEHVKCIEPLLDGYVLVDQLGSARVISADGEAAEPVQVVNPSVNHATIMNCSGVGTDRLYITTRSGAPMLSESTAFRFTAFDANLGTVWTYEQPIPVSFRLSMVANPITLADGSVLFSAALESNSDTSQTEIHTFVMDAGGNLLSHLEHEGSFESFDSLISIPSRNGTHAVLVESRWSNQQLVALEPDGTVKWKKPLQNLRGYQPCAMPTDSVLVCASRAPNDAQDTVFWIDPVNGETLFTRKLDLGRLEGGGDFFRALPVMATSDGHVILNERHLPPYAPQNVALNFLKSLTPGQFFYRMHVFSAQGDTIKTITLHPGRVQMGTEFECQYCNYDVGISPADAVRHVGVANGQLIVSGHTQHYHTQHREVVGETQTWVRAYELDP